MALAKHWGAWSYDSDSHTIADIVLSTCVLVKQRRADVRKVCGRLGYYQAQWFEIWFPCLAGIVDEMVRTHYGADNRDVTMPSPALKAASRKRT